MGANTVTSSTGTAAIITTDTVFTVSHTGRNYKNGINVYLAYTESGAGTVTITFDVLNPSIHTTNYFRMEQVLSTDATVTAVTMTLAAADGKFRLKVPMLSNETVLKVNVTIQTTGQDGILNIEFMED